MTNPSPAVVVPFRRILNLGGYFFLAVPLLTAVTYFTAGSKVAWSIGLGGIVPLIFFGVTVVAALLTASKTPQFMAGVVVSLSLFKMFSLLILLIVIKDAVFYDKVIFAITLLVTASVSLAVQAMVVMNSRVPTVDID
jgi:hypothetical protein